MTVTPDTSFPPTTVGARRSTWLTVLGIGVALGMMALGSVALIASRNDTWEQAEQSVGNLLLALDRDISRNIAVLDLSLQGLIEAYQEPGIGEVSVGIRRHALFDHSTLAENLGSMLVLDEGGDVVESSASVVAPKLNLGDRDYFKVHQHDPDVGMYISRVFKSRLSLDDLRLAISRRIQDGSDEFSGVAIGTLRLNYFKSLFEKLSVGKQGSITLVRTDGHLVIKYPFNPADVDRDVSGGRAFQRLLSAPSGQYVTKASIDGIERLYTFRRVGDLPLILSVNLSVDEILAPWRRKAMVIGPVLLLLCICAIASSLLFRREVARRSAIELALADAARKLSILASTDGLTGLANRRTFDLEYDRAFRRAVRNGTSLAVLMLDADWFKKYNDTYGHPAGDKILRSIGTLLRERLRRPDDLTARYGGEEFIALMPDTDLASARLVADQIRAAVQDLAIEHTGSPLGIVTVSIGVATALPHLCLNAAELIQAADGVLYEAKRDGRNCVCGIKVSDGTSSLEQIVAGVSPGGGVSISSDR